MVLEDAVHNWYFYMGRRKLLFHSRGCGFLVSPSKECIYNHHKCDDNIAWTRPVHVPMSLWARTVA